MTDPASKRMPTRRLASLIVLTSVLIGFVLTKHWLNAPMRAADRLRRGMAQEDLASANQLLAGPGRLFTWQHIVTVGIQFP